MNEAIRQVTHVQNIRYDKATERLYIIDQTLLPNEEKEIELRTVEEMIEAIKMLRIRGAPAIGICAGYCMYALARDIDAKDNETFYRKLQIDGELLGAARPTAVNLRWAVGEMLDAAKAHLKDNRAELLEVLYRKAVDIHEDDIAKCTAISEYGLSLLKDGDGVLTHCNAGPLATSRYGTGQGPFLLAAVLIKRDGFAIGGGDVKLMAVCGLLLGWKLIIFAFLLGCIIGSVIHLIRMKVSGEGHVLAMGPYLSAGVAIAVLWGNEFLQWYLHFYL